MKILLLFSLVFLTFAGALADTPPPGTVKAKMFSGDGNTSIGATGSSIDVDVTNTVPVSGTLTCTPSGTQNVSVQNSSIPVTGTFWQATQPVSGTLTCNAGSGTQNVSVQNSSIPVTGTFFQSTQPVSLSSLPALATGTNSIGSISNTSFTATQATGTNLHVVVDSAPTTAVTGTFFQATQPVSLMSLPALATGSNTIGNVNINGTVPVSGTVTATNSANGATGSAVPAQATQVGGSDGTNLRALKVSSAGVVSVDASATTQPISATSLPLPTGAATSALQNTINTTLGSPFQAGGSIGNTAFGISGTLPAFASTPTFNLGTLNGAATAANQITINTTLGTPFQAGGSIGNTAFGISGTLPAFASAPTFNLGTLNGAATAAKQPALGTAGTPSADVITVQGATSMTALKVDGSGVTQPVSGTVTANAGTGTMTVGQSTGTNLHTVVDSGSITATQTTGTNLHTVVDSGSVTDTRLPTALGLSAASASLPITLPNATTVTTTAFNSTTGVINTDMLTGSLSGWYDAAGYASFTADIYTTTTVTGGVITFEQTNDTTNDAAGITMNLQDASVITQTNVTSLTLAASTVKHYQAAITSRYIRFRISTAFAGTGTVGATVQFRQFTYMPMTIPVSQATAGSLNATIGSGTVTTVSTVSSVTSDQAAIPGIIADVASAAITTTTTTATLTPTFGVGYKVTIPVTVVSGTTPTMSVAVQESGDTGTDWVTVYTFPTITTTGYFESPPLFFKGNRVRYVQTITGTTPSFTRAINRLQMSAIAATPINNNATMATATVNSSCSTLTAPTGAVAFILESLSTNTVNMFWSMGATLATSTTGLLLEPGRDTGEVHAGVNVTLCAASGTPTYAIQWVQQ